MSGLRFRKRPPAACPYRVAIEAYQMTAERWRDMAGWPAWLQQAAILRPGVPGSVYAVDGSSPAVQTLEGPLRVAWGDWIIRGVRGELYPCKPDIFEETYEEAA